MRFFLLLMLAVSTHCVGASNPIIATKKIELPGYPGAFNPSLIKWGKGYLLTFRFIPDLGKFWISQIGVVFLDTSFNPISKPELLVTREEKNSIPSQSEDARIFTIKGETYLIYNDNLEVENPSMEDRREMFMAKLVYENNHFYLSNPTKLIYPSKYVIRMWEKNWVPFEWQDQLMICYTVVPHEVLKADFSRGIYKKASMTTPEHKWKWGSLRGGTPALLVDGEYLTFFHSSTMSGSWKDQKCWYYLGAYTFSAKPPFEIKKMTSEPLEGKDFYTDTTYFKKVIFPGGFVVKDSTIYLAYGKDDSEIWIATIDKERLQKVLEPIKNYE